MHVGEVRRASLLRWREDQSKTSPRVLRKEFGWHHCAQQSSGQPFQAPPRGLEQALFPQHEPKRDPAPGASAEAGSSPSPGAAGPESCAEVCFPFCIQPGSSPASRTVTAVCRASCRDVGFPFWKKFCSLIYSTLEKEKAIFLSALRNISCSVEIQLNYYERQKLTINTDSIRTRAHTHQPLYFIDYN